MLSKPTRNRIYGALFFSSALSITLLIIRIIASEQHTFLFLTWNLFLAAIPLAISSLLVKKKKKLRKHLLLFGIVGFWLAFFPNSNYIITDLFHLRPRLGIPLWFDLMLILSFAWNGLIMGIISLRDMQHVITDRYSPRVGWIFTISAAFLSGFGIYIGRFLRWNSWDIVTQPFGLMRDISELVFNPAAHPRTYAVTLIIGLFTLSVYYIFHSVTQQNR